jgi:hypothetical protein
MKYLYDYYSHPTPKTGTPDLQFIHLLVILAMGKALGGSTFQSDIPPGSEYFVMAIQRMPSFHALFGQPILLTEVLCCIALYFQCLDHRHASHAFVSDLNSHWQFHCLHGVLRLGKRFEWRWVKECTQICHRTS